jgi:putative PIN family toxin of toxin-antitoxin system
MEQLVVSFAIERTFQLFVSAPILLEYDSVLHRPKFRFPKERIAETMVQIQENSTLVVPTLTLAVSPDESDNRFLECAEAAGAEFLVTGNRRHFPSVWKATRIVSTREFVESVFNL